MRVWSEGTAGRQYAKVWQGAEPEGALRRVAWQRIAERLGEETEYFGTGIAEKYGLG